MARLAFLIFCLSLGGCGTDVRGLLQEDNRMAWDVEETVAAAEDAGPGLEHGLHRAELAKLEACKPLYQATDARVAREMSGDGLSFAAVVLK